MVYTVYKITNKINDKYYIGVHKTDNPNDAYMGSGLAIKNAIQKYGKQNFEKEILLISEDKQPAYDLEKELTVDFDKSNTYNMKRGGVGGFNVDSAKLGYQKMVEKVPPHVAGKISYDKKVGMFARSEEEFLKDSRKGGLANRGKPKSEEFKQKLRDVWKLKKQAMANGEPSSS